MQSEAYRERGGEEGYHGRTNRPIDPNQNLQRANILAPRPCVGVTYPHPVSLAMPQKTSIGTSREG